MGSVHNQHFKPRLAMFAVGIFLMTFGIALSCKADLGTSPISSVPWVMSMFLPFSLGDITIMMNIVMILAQPLILRALYVRELVGQLLTTLAFGCSIDFSMGLLDWFIPGSALEQWLACLLSIVVLALGVFWRCALNLFSCGRRCGQCTGVCYSKKVQPDQKLFRYIAGHFSDYYFLGGIRYITRSWSRYSSGRSFSRAVCTFV